jgi:hypothetical protein
VRLAFGSRRLYCEILDPAYQGKHMGTLRATLTALGIIIVLFGAIWFAVPGPSATERRGVAIGALLAGVVLLAVGLL